LDEERSCASSSGGKISGGDGEVAEVLGEGSR
jgi:hypothetical protein